MIGVLESYLLHSQIVDFWRKRQILTLVTCADRGGVGGQKWQKKMLTSYLNGHLLQK